MKRDAKPAVLSAAQIEESIGTLKAKLAEAQAATQACELAIGRDWQAMLAGGESKLRTELSTACDTEDALRLALDAAGRDLEEARAREKLAARLARRDELVQVLEERGAAADRLAAALDQVAESLMAYFDRSRVARAITGKISGARPTAEGWAVGVEEEVFEHLQVLCDLALRDRMPGLWHSQNAIEANVGPINEALRARGDRILQAFDRLADE